MRSFLSASLLALALIPLAPAAYAAPVSGYEALYQDVERHCSLPIGTLLDCENAINAYSNALIGAGVSLDAANASFQAVRAVVWTNNEPDPEFQADIDALFELLLPDSGALADAPAAGGGIGAGGLGPTRGGANRPISAR